MALVYHVTAETVRLLSRVATAPGLREKLSTVLRTARPLKPRHDVPVLELHLSEEEKAVVERDLCAALNRDGYEDGGERTPCGHVYEGLLRLIRTPNWRLG